MVLDHVADGPRLFIVATTPLQTEVLCHRDLYVIDITSVPHRLKDAVRQAEDQDILHGLFAQVVVDTIDLFLAKHFSNLAVEFFRRSQIVSERLFDNDTCPALAVSIQTSCTQILDNVGILAGWCREIEDAVAAGATPLINLIEQC